MNMLEAFIPPENIPSVLTSGAGALVAIFIVMFVVRKIVGMVVITALIIGGWMVWNDPTVLQSVRDTVSSYIDEWRHVPSEEDRPRW
ncbi:hypothetical protein [Rhizobium sp. AB2/73]|uniref:hypothetical protein n=1 Tax=Rhizobium sp. AB2/73 TaxID=2795216 RepID=UPI001C5EA6E6|nr:hypothetical protein [Rhizobium sp. AB2/73]QYA17566.1 hypothetical protein J5284_34655 [Rhizobium sp. AB2/73]UEQ85906.1 hypothetical protein I8E17_34695 [Rhizobium sp. AB2/73]